MIDYKAQYGNLVIGNFPDTVAKNASGPGATDGTPYDAGFISDLWGARQDLLAMAGMTPDGMQEAAGSSQFMEAFRRGAGLPPGMLVMGFFSSARKAVMRVLDLEGQIVPVDVYDKLTDAVWQGPSLNPTVECFYRCDNDANKTRNAAGAYLYLPDMRGLFPRAAGANSVHFPSVNTLYDGGSIGEHISDAIRNIIGTTTNFFVVTTNSGASGAFISTLMSYDQYIQTINNNGTGTGYSKSVFNAGYVVPVANENRPGSISVSFFISY